MHPACRASGGRATSIPRPRCRRAPPAASPQHRSPQRRNKTARPDASAACRASLDCEYSLARARAARNSRRAAFHRATWRACRYHRSGWRPRPPRAIATADAPRRSATRVRRDVRATRTSPRMAAYPASFSLSLTDTGTGNARRRPTGWLGRLRRVGTGQKLTCFRRRELARLARTEAAQQQTTDADALQADDAQPQTDGNLAYFAFAPFAHDHPHPRAASGRALDSHQRRSGTQAALQHHAAPPDLELLFIRPAREQHAVLLLAAVTGMCQPQRQFPVVGHENQALAFKVQPPNRE